MHLSVFFDDSAYPDVGTPLKMSDFKRIALVLFLVIGTLG